MSQSPPRIPLLTLLTKRKIPPPLIFNAQVALLYILLTSYCHACNSADSATCTPLSLSQNTETDVSTLTFGSTSCHAIDNRNASQRLSIELTILYGSAELLVLNSTSSGNHGSEEPDKKVVNVFSGAPGTFSAFLPQPGFLLPLPLLPISFHIDIVLAC